MFVRLTRYAYAPIAALALWAVLLTLSPATATAQETSRANDPQMTDRNAGAAERVVVAPGDSLWSISESQLGPNATPLQIADGVERIYALNHAQIGADPNKIFAGQRLVLPPAVERQAPEPARPASARGTAAPAKVSPTSHVAQSSPDRAFRPTVGEFSGKGGQAPEAAAEGRTLPDEAAAAPVPLVRSLAADGTPHSSVAFMSGARAMASSAVSALSGVPFAADDPYAGRKLLGAAVLAMSSALFLVLVVLVDREVWAPRRARRARRRLRERWMREVFGRTYAAPTPFTDDHPYAGPFMALERRSLERRHPEEAANPVPSEELQHRTLSTP